MSNGDLISLIELFVLICTLIETVRNNNNHNK